MMTLESKKGCAQNLKAGMTEHVLRIEFKKRKQKEPDRTARNPFTALVLMLLLIHQGKGG